MHSISVSLIILYPLKRTEITGIFYYPVVVTSHTEISLCGMRFTRAGRSTRYTDTSIPACRLRTIRMHQLHLQLQLGAVLESISHLATGTDRFRSVPWKSTKWQYWSEAIGTLMTGITSWEILHLLSLFFTFSFSFVFFALHIFLFLFRLDTSRAASTNIDEPVRVLFIRALLFPLRFRLRFVGVMSRCTDRI